MTAIFNPPLNGSPPIEFLIDLLVAQLRLLRFDDLLQPADSIVEKIGTELEFLSHGQFRGAPDVRLFDRCLELQNLLRGHRGGPKRSERNQAKHKRGTHHQTCTLNGLFGQIQQ